MTIKAWLHEASRQLSEAEISSVQLDAELILAHVLDKPREYLVAHSDEDVSSIDQTNADNLIKKRAAHHPLVHLTGQREFYGLDFEITPDVLTPRVETELMVELAIKHTPQNGMLLDVGTGSGAIAIATSKNRTDLGITATDVSAVALRVARKNAAKHEVKIKLIESNLLDDVTGQFDVITANLPYLTDDADLMPEVKYEPRVALVGGPDGLDLYRKFFDKIGAHLSPGGIVIIEADPWQHSDLIALAEAKGLEVAQDDYFILMLKLPKKP